MKVDDFAIYKDQHLVVIESIVMKGDYSQIKLLENNSHRIVESKHLKPLTKESAKELIGIYDSYIEKCNMKKNLIKDCLLNKK